MNSANTPEVTRRLLEPLGTTVRSVALLTFCATVIWSVTSWLIQGDAVGLEPAGFTLLASALALLLERRGFTVAAAWTLVIPGWLVLVVSIAAVPQGEFSPVYNAIPIPIFAAGLLLGQRAAGGSEGLGHDGKRGRATSSFKPSNQPIPAMYGNPF